MYLIYMNISITCNHILIQRIWLCMRISIHLARNVCYTYGYMYNMHIQMTKNENSKHPHIHEYLNWSFEEVYQMWILMYNVQYKSSSPKDMQIFETHVNNFVKTSKYWTSLVLARQQNRTHVSQVIMPFAGILFSHLKNPPTDQG